MFSKFAFAAVLLLAVQANAQQKSVDPFESTDVAARPTGECADKPYSPGYYALEATECKQYLHCDEFGNSTVFNCGEGTVFDQEFNTCNYPENVNCSDSAKFYDVNKGIGEETGVETPEAPKTSFSCAGKPYVPGLYADLENKCATFHYCYDDRVATFSCPENTLFNQQILTCDWADNVNCEQSSQHYDSNKGIGEPTAEASEALVQQQQADEEQAQAEEPQAPEAAPAPVAQYPTKTAAPAPAPVKAPEAAPAPIAQYLTKTAAPAPAPIKAPARVAPSFTPVKVAKTQYPTVEAQVPVYKSKTIAALRRSSFARKAAGTKA